MYTRLVYYIKYLVQFLFKLLIISNGGRKLIRRSKNEKNLWRFLMHATSLNKKCVMHGIYTFICIYILVFFFFGKSHLDLAYI